MNANELAQWLEQNPDETGHLKEAATLLRSLSAEITVLKQNQFKDLTDIEINKVWNETFIKSFGNDELKFARAILKKVT
jgi:hypothetical protein